MGISIWQLLIVLGIVVLLFGTKKLRNIGTDLGGAIRGFKKSMEEDEPEKKDEEAALEEKQEEPLHEAKTESTEEKTRS